ncbi:MAG: hypothetical protein V4717_01500 [Bacteroidota bacterium]
MNTHKFQNQVAILSILAGVLALTSIYLIAAGAGYNMAVFENPSELLGMTTADAGLLKASMIADMFGYYLLLLPALVYFQRYLKTRTSWSYVISWCGSAYILIGAIGAAILSVTWPAYVVEYPIATVLEQEIIKRNFELLNQLVYGGLWNTLEVVLAAAWWLGIGIAVRKDLPVFGILSIVLAFASIIDGVGNMLGLPNVAALGLNIYLVLGIAWPVWFGASLLYNSRKVNVNSQRLVMKPNLELA